jgi:hypothetical protein
LALDVLEVDELIQWCSGKRGQTSGIELLTGDSKVLIPGEVARESGMMSPTNPI